MEKGQRYLFRVPAELTLAIVATSEDQAWAAIRKHQKHMFTAEHKAFQGLSDADVEQSIIVHADLTQAKIIGRELPPEKIAKAKAEFGVF